MNHVKTVRPESGLGAASRRTTEEMVDDRLHHNRHQRSNSHASDRKNANQIGPNPLWLLEVTHGAHGRAGERQDDQSRMRPPDVNVLTRVYAPSEVPPSLIRRRATSAPGIPSRPPRAPFGNGPSRCAPLLRVGPPRRPPRVSATRAPIWHATRTTDRRIPGACRWVTAGRSVRWSWASVRPGKLVTVRRPDGER